MRRDATTSRDVNENVNKQETRRSTTDDGMLIAELIGKEKSERGVVSKTAKTLTNHDSFKYSRIQFQDYAN